MSFTNSCQASGNPYPWGNIRSGFRAGLSPLIFPILLFDLYKKIDINITPSASGGTSQCICVFGEYYGGFFVSILFADLMGSVFLLRKTQKFNGEIYPTFYPQPLAECFWG